MLLRFWLLACVVSNGSLGNHQSRVSYQIKMALEISRQQAVGGLLILGWCCHGGKRSRKEISMVRDLCDLGDVVRDQI